MKQKRAEDVCLIEVNFALLFCRKYLDKKSMLTPEIILVVVKLGKRKMNSYAEI